MNIDFIKKNIEKSRKNIEKAGEQVDKSLDNLSAEDTPFFLLGGLGGLAGRKAYKESQARKLKQKQKEDK